MGARGSINRLRIALWEKQKGRCHYCDIHMVRSRKPAHDVVTVDHIVPKCEGGTRSPDNVVGACHTCNNARGSTPYAVFVALVRTRGRPAPPPMTDAKNAPEWLKQRQAKADARAAAVKAREGHWSAPKMPAARPYLDGLSKYPTMAEALADAGAVPDELNDELVAVRERWGS